MINYYVYLPSQPDLVLLIGPASSAASLQHIRDLPKDMTAAAVSVVDPGDGEAGFAPHGVESSEVTLTKQDQALGLLVAHPEWTNARIARAVRVSRTTLYSWPKFCMARAWLRTMRERFPQGTKSKDGRLEAYALEDDEVE